MSIRTGATVILCVVSVLVMTGCASAPRYTDQPYAQYDKNTEYAITEETGGFTVFVYYSVYQYFPDESTVQASAKQIAMAIAYEHADENNREIEPINEQRIKMTSGRNGLLGITTASVSLRAFWSLSG